MRDEPARLMDSTLTDGSRDNWAILVVVSLSVGTIAPTVYHFHCHYHHYHHHHHHGLEAILASSKVPELPRSLILFLRVVRKSLKKLL